MQNTFFDYDSIWVQDKLASGTMDKWLFRLKELDAGDCD